MLSPPDLSGEPMEKFYIYVKEETPTLQSYKEADNKTYNKN